jgi:hypothetical protein
MKTVTIRKFAEMAIALDVGASIRFQHTDEDANVMEYIIAPVKLGDSDCLLANCVGGGRPLVIDISTYDSGLKAICEELDQYINYATGKFGFVTVLKEDDAAAGQIHVLVRYPETDMEPEVIRFALNEGTGKKALISYVKKAAGAIRKKRDQDGDRLDHLDAFRAHIKDKTGCDSVMVYPDHEVDIW